MSKLEWFFFGSPADPKDPNHDTAGRWLRFLFWLSGILRRATWAVDKQARFRIIKEEHTLHPRGAKQTQYGPENCCVCKPKVDETELRKDMERRKASYDLRPGDCKICGAPNAHKKKKQKFTHFCDYSGKVEQGLFCSNCEEMDG